MDNDTENGDKKNLNTEYLPTKCRITKPPPPKPATNPLQFVKVAPCPLFQKAHEQIKKVEEIKKERKEVKEEAEDWQQNLDNWKSSRRKRQEHIIERVVEVKKFEQEEQDRLRKRSKTFNEMIEERGRGRHKFNIPIYDDDSNDLSDYGLRSNSSKITDIKTIDINSDTSTDSYHLNELNDYLDCSKKPAEEHDVQETNSTNKMNQSLDETSKLSPVTIETVAYSTTNPIKCQPNLEIEKNYEKNDINEQYTYEGAIQDYRSRITSKIHVDESIFTRNQDNIKSKEYSEAQTAIPKGEICKRKELFEMEKSIEIHPYESRTAKQLSEDFANTQSIKQRLQSLEKCVDLPLKPVDKSDMSLVKQRLQNFNKQLNTNSKDNNINYNNHINNNVISNKNINDNNNSNHMKENSFKSNNYHRTDKYNNADSCLNNACEIDLEKLVIEERCSSPETEMYINKLNVFSKDLDTLMYNSKSSPSSSTICQSSTLTTIDKEFYECCANQNYPPSTCSTELTGISSDREDSGIHTADVSCSVSQADECADDFSNCINQLTLEDKYNGVQQHENSNESNESKNSLNFTEISSTSSINDDNNNTSNSTKASVIENCKEIVDATINLLENLRKDSSLNLIVETQEKSKLAEEEKHFQNIYNHLHETNLIQVDPLAPPTAIEPPNVKPPPPPPIDNFDQNPSIIAIDNSNIKRMNSTKRIKREIHIKRSSFLGLEEPNDSLIYPVLNVDKPPDINSFLQKESKLEKSLYKKVQEETRTGVLSKVESLDSGLDIDRGRLSSDTWCSSSIGNSTTPSPERHDSEQTNSITSEEDEITKKEREIIELVEKEEKSRDGVQYTHKTITNDAYVKPEHQQIPYFSDEIHKNYLDDQDSEVLKVEHELRQLEKEELERQRDNRLFEESRARARLQGNRHSLENIFDQSYPLNQDGVNYRKSMPELQVPLEYRNSATDTPHLYNKYTVLQHSNSRGSDIQYRKSMPDLPNTYHRTSSDYRNLITTDNKMKAIDHRKSMPDMLLKSPMALKSGQQGKLVSPLPINKDQKERFLLINNPGISDAMPHPPNIGTTKHRQLSKNSLQALSAVPKTRHIHMDNWIQPRINPEVKSYNQHWLYQEAELRRIADQKNMAANRNIQRNRQERYLPDAVIQTITQRVQNRADIGERNQILNSSQDGIQQPPQHSYLGHSQTLGHALPMPYSPQLGLEESQDRMLSVSGKKKCSYCNNELGRGAAMIIESLCLFYHMECFKCCVCHVQLGDGLMGTDVRVRNQKLHCHNCYSSDDGIKFSCV